MKLNLGCEKEYLEGWVNVDFDTRIIADEHFNLNNMPYKFKENTFDEILASAILEHLDNPSKALMELWRISKPKAKVYILAPHFSDAYKFVDLEHKHFFGWFSFGCWDWNKELYPYFKVVKKKIHFTRVHYPWLNYIFNPLINLFPVIYERLFSGILRASVITFVLEVVKDELEIKTRLQEQDCNENNFMPRVNNLEFIRK